MQSVGKWVLDPDNLRFAYDKWLRTYHPSQAETQSVDQWLERALEGPGFVGIRDDEHPHAWYGRVEGTDFVVEYSADVSVRRIWISKIERRKPT